MNANTDVPNEPPHDPGREAPAPNPAPEKTWNDPVNVPPPTPDVIFPGSGEPLGIPPGPGPDIPDSPTLPNSPSGPSAAFVCPLTLDPERIRLTANGFGQAGRASPRRCGFFANTARESCSRVYPHDTRNGRSKRSAFASLYATPATSNPASVRSSQRTSASVHSSSTTSSRFCSLAVVRSRLRGHRLSSASSTGADKRQYAP